MVLAHIDMAYVVMAQIIRAYINMTYIVVAYMVMAYIGMAYIVMVCICMAYQIIASFIYRRLSYLFRYDPKCLGDVSLAVVGRRWMYPP